MDEDDDGLYDSLPEICDLPPTLLEGMTESSARDAEIFHFSFSATESSRKISKKKISDKPASSKCLCGDSLQWTWENNDNSSYVKVENKNRDVRFHVNFSGGTALARCTEPMFDGQYYWEVKLTHPVYGTDVMLGVGTADVEMKDLENQFVSFLGSDDKTWGFSYRGFFQHNGLAQCYSECFGQGDVIGVHLDLWRGTLSFYKDRKNLGIATSGLRGRTLYAMVSSTAAFSGMRLVQSSSFPSSLQFLCCTKLRQLVPGDKSVLDALNLPPGLRRYLKRRLNWLLSERHLSESDICSIDHNKDIEGISNESAMESVFFTSYPPCVLFQNLNRFQGEGANGDEGNFDSS